MAEKRTVLVKLKKKKLVTVSCPSHGWNGSRIA